jgi:hypothetical protein
MDNIHLRTKAIIVDARFKERCCVNMIHCAWFKLHVCGCAISSSLFTPTLVYVSVVITNQRPYSNLLIDIDIHVHVWIYPYQ